MTPQGLSDRKPLRRRPSSAPTQLKCDWFRFTYQKSSGRLAQRESTTLTS
jgi:hypothetical protein